VFCLSEVCLSTLFGGSNYVASKMNDELETMRNEAAVVYFYVTIPAFASRD
jgi:hypothetical protein